MSSLCKSPPFSLLSVHYQGAFVARQPYAHLKFENNLANREMTNPHPDVMPLHVVSLAPARPSVQPGSPTPALPSVTGSISEGMSDPMDVAERDDKVGIGPPAENIAQEFVGKGSHCEGNLREVFLVCRTHCSLSWSHLASEIGS